MAKKRKNNNKNYNNVAYKKKPSKAKKWAIGIVSTLLILATAGGVTAGVFAMHPELKPIKPATKVEQITDSAIIVEDISDYFNNDMYYQNVLDNLSVNWKFNVNGTTNKLIKSKFPTKSINSDFYSLKLDDSDVREVFGKFRESFGNIKFYMNDFEVTGSGLAFKYNNLVIIPDVASTVSGISVNFSVTSYDVIAESQPDLLDGLYTLTGNDFTFVIDAITTPEVNPEQPTA